MFLRINLPWNKTEKQFGGKVNKQPVLQQLKESFQQDRGSGKKTHGICFWISTDWVSNLTCVWSDRDEGRGGILDIDHKIDNNSKLPSFTQEDEYSWTDNLRPCPESQVPEELPSSHFLHKRLFFSQS